MDDYSFSIKRIFVAGYGIAALVGTSIALSRASSSGYAMHLPLLMIAGTVATIGGVMFLEWLLGIRRNRAYRPMFKVEVVNLYRRKSAICGNFLNVQAALNGDGQPEVLALVSVVGGVRRGRPSLVKYFEIGAC